MFNSSKTSDIKENTEQLVDNTKARVSRVAKQAAMEAKSAAGKISRRAGSAGKQTRKEAVALLDTLRDEEVARPRPAPLLAHITGAARETLRRIA